MTWKPLAASLLALGAVALAGAVLVDRKAERRAAAAERAYPPEGRLLDVGGRQVHAVVAGQGPDLVLLHGASGNVRDFTFAVVDRLKGRYRVIVFDRPGHGWTDRADAGYGGAFDTAAESPAEEARLLQAAAAQLGAARPLVLGQSYGASVALAWALERPEALSGLVILAGASNPWPGRLRPFYRISASALGGAVLAPLLAAFAPENRAADSIDGIFAPQSPPQGYADHIGVALALRPAAFRANARQVNGLRPHLVEMSARYGGIDLPTEIVHGTADQVVPLAIHSEPLSRQIPGARLTRLDGIGHMPHHVAPEAVDAAIDRAAARAGLR